MYQKIIYIHINVLRIIETFILLLQASQDHKTNFMKIHAPNIVLERYAEIVNMQKPIKVLEDTIYFL